MMIAGEAIFAILVVNATLSAENLRAETTLNYENCKNYRFIGRTTLPSDSARTTLGRLSDDSEQLSADFGDYRGRRHI